MIRITTCCWSITKFDNFLAVFVFSPSVFSSFEANLLGSQSQFRSWCVCILFVFYFYRRRIYICSHMFLNNHVNLSWSCRCICRRRCWFFVVVVSVPLATKHCSMWSCDFFFNKIIFLAHTVYTNARQASISSLHIKSTRFLFHRFVPTLLRVTHKCCTS